ncbi:MAG: acyl-CoA reductase, partial [Aureibaculum sp.]
MSLEKRINAFVELGNFMRQFSRQKIKKNSAVLYNDLFFEAFTSQIKRAKEFNGWFTEENILFAFEKWSNQLTKNKLDNWTSIYNLDNNTPKTIADIMAGNIPLVGFHDFLSVLL